MHVEMRYIGPEEEYASGAQLIREFWSRLRGDGITGVREAILVPDMGKELKAQARRQEIRRRMGGKTAAEGNGGWGSSEQEDDPDPGDRDAELVAAARRIVADTRHAGTRLSQIALAEKLRSEGYKVANNRLRWLAAVSGLEAGQDGEPDARADGGR